MVFEYFERDLARYMQEAGALSESRALAIWQQLPRPTKMKPKRGIFSEVRGGALLLAAAQCHGPLPRSPRRAPGCQTPEHSCG